VRTGLDSPAGPSATASRVPAPPRGSAPPHPAGLAAARFQATFSTRGTPRVKRTGGLAPGPQAAESHTTWPCLVTTTCTEPGPYRSVHGAAAVETA
jgi:hypothetical protein